MRVVYFTYSIPPLKQKSFSNGGLSSPCGMCRYRSLYNYVPKNIDELELKEGDEVDVVEKCDDGWFVGTSLRTNIFGTFPGNYVEALNL